MKTTRLLFQHRYTGDIETGYIVSLWLFNFPIFGVLASVHGEVFEFGLCVLSIEIGIVRD
jgi:hypothetical protein